MNIISTTAKANIQQNKSRNILIATAIILTSILLTAVPIAGLGGYLPRIAAANKILPTFHTMYRGVNQDTLDQMKENQRFEFVGSRIDLGQMICEDATILMSAYDQTGETLNKITLEEGTLPERNNEIVVSKGMLDAMGIEAAIGDTIRIPYQVYEKDGLSLQKELDFTVCGLAKTPENNEKKLYGAIVSEALVKESIKSGERDYRTYITIANSEKLTTSAIRAKAEELADSYGIIGADTVHNDEYLLANYVDPSVYSITAIIMLIIIFAAIMTIYSIYYVSMMNKIQEYGKLKAMGATKKQIKSIVFREGFFVACIAIPIGVCLGCLLGYAITYSLIVTTNQTSKDVLVKTMKEMLQNGEVQVVQPWIVVAALVISFITVYFSLKKPMKIASRISAIEAIRCHSTQKEKKKTRKGFHEINLMKLTMSNLSRNKKRTVITILTLGIISVLFMTVATVLSCMRPEDRARHDVRGDYRLALNYQVGDKMNPDKELHIMQMKNPLNEALKTELESVHGIEKIEPMLATYAEADGWMDGDEPYRAYVTGVQQENMEEMSRLLLDGTIDMKKWQDGSGVIIDTGYLNMFMDVQIGDTFTVQLRDGDRIVPHTFTVMAVTEAPRSTYGNSDFIMSAEALQRLCQTDLTSEFNISVSKQELKEVEEILKSLVLENDAFRYASYQAALSSATEAVKFTLNAAYAFLAALGTVGMLNLINTMINSVYVRKKELGILQAIGLSDKQMLRMLQLEGLFYTAGTLLLGLGLGNFFGYLCFLSAKENHIMDIRVYHYPLLPTIALTLTILVIQIFVTYIVNKNFKKESLIERVRFSD